VVKPRARRVGVCGLAVAVAALAACSAKDEPGIEVRVDLAGFAGQVQTLQVAVAASGGGFVAQGPTNVDNIPIRTEDIDGDGQLELVATFQFPKSPVTFRVAPQNQTMLDVSGHALAFSDTALMAGDDSPAPEPLPPGGRASIALTLTTRTPGIVGPDTRTTDIKTLDPDITVTTTVMPAGLSSVATCDVDGDGARDIVIGDPAAESVGIPVGAVHILLGTNGFGSKIDLNDSATGMEFHFYGATAGDRLGAAVACANLNGDSADDLIVGAPGANGGGRVYAIFGGRMIATRSITPGSPTQKADVSWESSVADAGFGGLLFAADLNGDGKAEILAGGGGTGKVHLLKNVTQAAASAISVDDPDHVTFSNTAATSITAGDLRRAGGVDVVIGNAEAKMMSSTIKSGAIFGFADVALDGTTQYDAAAATMTMFGGENMQFGAAVLAVDTTGYGQDLIVGAPGDGAGAGAIYVYKGDSEFFSVATRNYMPPEAVMVVSGPSASGRFGAALAATPTGTTPPFDWDLVVGAPATSRNDARTLVGAAYLFAGGKTWDFPLVEQVYGAETGDRLGAFVAGGQVDADAFGDLVTVAPGGNGQSGAVYVRYDHRKQ
jgi:hypothetical protein